jgi:hypothetical protein
MALATQSKQYEWFVVTEDNLGDAEALGLLDSPHGALLDMVVVQAQDSMGSVQVMSQDDFALQYIPVPASDSTA